MLVHVARPKHVEAFLDLPDPPADALRIDATSIPIPGAFPRSTCFRTEKSYENRGRDGVYDGNGATTADSPDLRGRRWQSRRGRRVVGKMRTSQGEQERRQARWVEKFGMDMVGENPGILRN